MQSICLNSMKMIKENKTINEFRKTDISHTLKTYKKGGFHRSNKIPGFYFEER